MNILQSNKPFRLKHVSKHVLANIILSVLVCYLILAVEQLRAGNCSTQLTSPLKDITSHQETLTPPSQPHQPQQPEQPEQPEQPQQPEQPKQPQQQQQQQQQNPPSPQLSADQLKVERLDSIARRKRPQPSCVDGNQAKTFLMLFMGHSGSSAITSELRGHPQIHVELAELVDHQEVFNTTAALQATREFFDRGIAAGKTPGFKIRPNHIINEPEKWIDLVEEYDTRIIWQYRQNIFKAAVGEYSNRYLNDTSVVEGLRQNFTKEERCKIGVGCSYPIKDLVYLHNLLKTMVRSQQSIVEAVHKITQKRKDCVRELPYEDYLYEREASLADIFKFLGVRQEPTQPLRYKATDDNLCNVVENWQETCNAFYGCTLYQHMIDDPRNDCFCTILRGTSQFCALVP